MASFARRVVGRTFSSAICHAGGSGGASCSPRSLCKRADHPGAVRSPRDCPYASGGVFARVSAGVRVVQLPFEPPRIALKQFWHRRVHNDARNRWLRALVCRLFQRESNTWLAGPGGLVSKRRLSDYYVRASLGDSDARKKSSR